MYNLSHRLLLSSRCLQVDEEDLSTAEQRQEALQNEGNKKGGGKRGAEEGGMEEQEGMEVDGDTVMTMTVERPPESYFHTLMDEGKEAPFHLSSLVELGNALWL